MIGNGANGDRAMQASDHTGLWVLCRMSQWHMVWLGYLQQRESDIKAKMRGYMAVPNEQANHQFIFNH